MQSLLVSTVTTNPRILNIVWCRGIRENDTDQKITMYRGIHLCLRWSYTGCDTRWQSIFSLHESWLVHVKIATTSRLQNRPREQCLITFWLIPQQWTRRTFSWLDRDLYPQSAWHDLRQGHTSNNASRDNRWHCGATIAFIFLMILLPLNLYTLESAVWTLQGWRRCPWA